MADAQLKPAPRPPARPRRAATGAADEVIASGWSGPLPRGTGPATYPQHRVATALHYYFAESEHDPAEDPVVLSPGRAGRLQHGGIFTEVGPFSLNELSPASADGADDGSSDTRDANGTHTHTSTGACTGAGESPAPRLFRNPYAWTRRASVLRSRLRASAALRRAAGRRGARCPHRNDTLAATDNAAFLCNFFRAFPAFRKNPL